MDPDIDLDRFDQRLLALLEADSRRTGDQLSELIGLSPAACLRRVQRLRKIGAIEREVAIISPKLKNRGTKVIVLLTIDRQNPKLMDEFCHRLRRQDEVMSLDWVTGDDDIIVIVDCPTMADFSDFCERHLNDTPVVGYKSLVSMKSYDTQGE